MTERADWTVRDKIDAGAYEPHGGAFVPALIKPAVLNKRADQLTPAEMTALPAVARDWTAAMAAHKAAERDRRTEQGRLHEQFRLDLCNENGVLPSDPFAAEMFGLAWGSGHGSGLSEIVSAFEALLPLWELYRAQKA